MRTGIKPIRGSGWYHNPFESTHDSYRSSHTNDPDILEHIIGHDIEEFPSEKYASSI